MTSNELRQKFLDFFISKNHKLIPSDSLIPKDDPTLLFTGSGMNQFKDYFLGRKKDLSRVATCQKCLRTADLEKVGITPYHHTFFEMLGNFSFGDYFKKEAIEWAWEFLTDVLKIDSKCLNVSVYEEDEESYLIWRNDIGLDDDRIRRLGQDENFWPANAPKGGPNGPCGPCSEIFYCMPEGKPIEVWNLVFTQFDRQSDGALKDLPQKNIDTGMGLERLASVMQGLETNFETDLFKPIIKELCSRFKVQGSRLNLEPIYAVADHIRAITFAIGDGVMPSNEERGYVVRKLIRKASWHSRSIGISKPYLYKLVSAVINVMEKPYQELKQQTAHISKTVKFEEEQFANILEEGTEKIEGLIQELKKSGIGKISGEDAFKFYDTYGFPVELTMNIAQERGLSVDMEMFYEAMNRQKQRSRILSQIASGAFIFTQTYKDKLNQKFHKTEFVGYDELEEESIVIGIFKNEEQLQKADRDNNVVDVILDKTPFYGESGGQVGDEGFLKDDERYITCRVRETKLLDNIIVHRVEITEGTLISGQRILAKVDKRNRFRIARNHAATHILHYALREMLGKHTRQSGSLVEVERLRFDFTCQKALTNDEIERIEDRVNELITDNDKVETMTVKLEDAKKSGALAFFDERYGETVRMVCIGNYSKELCGGCHTSRTGEIGIFKILNEQSIAAGIRRIEAVTSMAARESIRKERKDAFSKIEELEDKIKILEQQLDTIHKDHIKTSALQILSTAQNIGRFKFIVSEDAGFTDTESLRKAVDILKTKANSLVIALGCVKDNKPSFVISLTQDLVKEGFSALTIAKEVAGIIGGSCGGRADFAQGGGKEAPKLKGALDKVMELVT